MCADVRSALDVIVIRCCHLRVVRRSGWSWGPDPPALLRDVLDAFPALLAARLAAMLDDANVDATIDSTLHVLVAATAAELRHAREAMRSPAPRRAAMALPIEERIDTALRQAVEAAGAAHLLRGSRAAPLSSTPAPRSAPPVFAPDGASARLGILLAAWYREHSPATHLDLLSPTARATLRRLVMEEATNPRPSSHAPLPSNGQLASIAEGVVAAAHTASGGDADRAWLLAAVELGARFALPPSDRAIVEALDTVLPPSRAAPTLHNVSAPATKPLPGTTPPASEAAPDAQAPIVSGRRRALGTPRSRGDVHVASALPFLLLGPLSRVGYLASLAAVFDAAHIGAHLPAFATALAYKVLPPPERGWRRAPASMTAATTFAALDEPPAEAELNGLDRLLAPPHVELLSATLARSLIAGHLPGTPLALTTASAGLVLADAAGSFPIAWGAADLSALLPILSSLGGETVVVPRAVATRERLQEMDARNVRFVTDAPPTRDELWRAIGRSTDRRWWTNDGATTDAALTRRAADGVGAADDMTSLWRALADERPSLALSSNSAVETAITLAAGVALATIAWLLWHDREATMPLLALTRLGDLDARVSFGAQSVRVIVPLGRRHRDLYACGLLDPVRDIPWLGGRVLELGGG
jgi:hypothetical protein